MSYAGDLTPPQAHELLRAQPNAVLVDCRTNAEWAFVGVPAVDGTRFVEWTRFPDGSRNPDFVARVSDGLEADQPLVILCRSGGRSVAAAHELTSAGFSEVYNVLEGFEGDVDASGHRSGGWRGAGLPWLQK